MEKIQLVVKPNSKKTEITKEENGIVYVSIAAKPEDNKANIEIIKFFTKRYGTKVKLKGLKSRNKILIIE